MSYSKEFKVFVATIYGEAANSSIRSWEIIAHSMRNRIGFGNWTEYSTIYAIATTTGYDAYTRKNDPYNEAMSQFKSEKISSSLKTLINTVRPIYEGKIKDDTNGVVFYWSPKAQKQLHRDNPKLYTTAIPDWVKDNKKEIVKIAGTEKDDFQWLRFKRSKMFATLHDNKGLPMDGVSVDIRFASGKKVPVLSNLKTNSKGQLPVFFARIEMGARFIVDGTYLKDKKGSNLKILPTGKDIVATIIVDTGNGFKSSLEKHETGSENTQVRNDTVGIDSTQKTNNTSDSGQSNNLKEVTFDIKLVESDTGKAIPNATYHLEYKNNIKPHKTDSLGIESGIKADVSQSIGVYLDDDGGKKQSIYSMAFPVTGDLNGQTKVLKVPVVTLQLKFIDKNKKPVPNYDFKTVYRGRTSEIKKANARGIATVKALAGQQLKIIHVAANKFTSNIVTDGSTEWTYSTDKLIENNSNSTGSTASSNAPSTKPSSQKPSSTKPSTSSEVSKGTVIRDDKVTQQGPTHEVRTKQAKITVKFLDEATNKPLSGLTYWTQSTEYGKNASTTGSDGTRGRTHDSDVGVSIAVIVNENGKEIKKGTIVANSDKNGTAYVYKAKKPKNYLYPLPINATADYKSGMRSFGSNRSSGKRKHAGADLYAPTGTTVRAMESGIVLSSGSFYASTDFVTIKHQNHIIRYGELAPGSIRVKAEDKVTRGQPIGAVGKLKGINVPSDMLHLEMYSNTSDTSNLTIKGAAGGKFKRRSDLINPNPFLDNADK